MRSKIQNSKFRIQNSPTNSLSIQDLKSKILANPPLPTSTSCPSGAATRTAQASQEGNRTPQPCGKPLTCAAHASRSMSLAKRVYHPSTLRQAQGSAHPPLRLRSGQASTHPPIHPSTHHPITPSTLPCGKPLRVYHPSTLPCGKPLRVYHPSTHPPYPAGSRSASTTHPLPHLPHSKLKTQNYALPQTKPAAIGPNQPPRS